MADETQLCPVCDTELGKTEKVCPKCGTDLETINEDVISNVERAMTVVEKRRKAKADADKVVQAEAKRKAEAEAAAKRKPSFWDGLKGKK